VFAFLVNSTASGPALSPTEKMCIKMGVIEVLGTYSNIINEVCVMSEFDAQSTRSFTNPVPPAWNLTIVIEFNTTKRDLARDLASIHADFNASLYSGSLQEDTRTAALEAQPPVETVAAAVFCSQDDPTRCLLTPPPNPAAGSARDACARASGTWAKLYGLPSTLPWYMFWLILLLTVWCSLTLWVAWGVSCAVGVDGYALALLCAAARVVYFALLITQFYSTDNHFACMEFAFVESKSFSPFYWEWSVALVRSLFYPVFALLCK